MASCPLRGRGPPCPGTIAPPHPPSPTLHLKPRGWGWETRLRSKSKPCRTRRDRWGEGGLWEAAASGQDRLEGAWGRSPAWSSKSAWGNRAHWGGGGGGGGDQTWEGEWL